MSTVNRDTLETAIRAFAADSALLARFKADPIAIGQQVGLSAEWSEAISRGDRDKLRSAGLNDGLTILVSRWFADDIGDSASSGRFYVDVTSPLPAPDVPSQLVFAGGCSHVPDLLARPEIDPSDAVERLLEGYKRLAEKLSAASPDLIIVTTDCHFQSFKSGAIVVGTGSAHEGSMAFFKRPDLNLVLKGDPEFATAIVRTIRARGLEVEEEPRIDLDHGLIVPLRLILPRSDLPVIPIVTQPARSFSPFGARAFGDLLRKVLESTERRVAVLATGGLSHWLDPGKFGRVDLEFDSFILETLKAGRGLDLGNLEPYALLEHGQYEFLNWLIMLALAGPGIRGEVFAYEPMKASGGGWAVVNMMLRPSNSLHAYR
jgi:aromatic ring-opening dioxygenase catalytic subunit (LigB family)